MTRFAERAWAPFLIHRAERHASSKRVVAA
jgi:hypothetical protein